MSNNKEKIRQHIAEDCWRKTYIPQKDNWSKCFDLAFEHVHDQIEMRILMLIHAQIYGENINTPV